MKNRRELLGGAAAAAAAALLPKTVSGAEPAPAKAAAPAGSFVIVTSANGVIAAQTAREALTRGYDPLDAAIAGVNVVENDPNDVTVGYGGIPNEEGVVQLDACVMDGRTQKSGAVGALEGCKTPSKVARLVMDRTDRCFLVGEGARKFATANGFPVEELLTERSRKIWLAWKDAMSDYDDWMESGKEAADPDLKWFLNKIKGDEELRWFYDKYVHEEYRPQGTIHMSVRSAKGELVGVTTTSGLFFKMPGRLGDSPCPGAGIYTEGGVGSCGSTGRGEANLDILGSHAIVELLRQGKAPEEACLEVLKRVAEKTHHVPRHRDSKGRPKFGLSYYCVDAKGRAAGASMWSGAKYVVGDADGVRTLECAYLYKKGS